MTRNNLAVLATGILLTGFTISCKKDRLFGIVKGKGPIVTESRFVQNFQGIELNTSATVNYTNDTVYSIEIKGQKNLLDKIETKVNGNKLSISSNCEFLSGEPVEIIIHAPNLNAFILDGSGDINVLNAINPTILEGEINGSGNLKVISAVVSDLKMRIGGSGDIEVVNGSAENALLEIDGSGEIICNNCKTKQAKANISGSGDIYVWATDNLTGSISGSGTIAYKGFAKVSTQISGSGKVKSIN